MVRRSSRDNRLASIGPLIVVFILLGGLSLAAGYFGGQYLLRGLSEPARESSEDPPDPPDPSDPSPEDPTSPTAAGDEPVTLSTAPLRLFRVQVGAFGIRENAEAFAAEMRDEGYPAAVMSLEDEMHRVIVAVTGSESEGRRAVDVLDAAGHEALAAAWAIPGFEREVEVSPLAGELLESLMDKLPAVLMMEADLPVLPSEKVELPELLSRAGDLRDLCDQLDAVRDEVPEDLMVLVEVYLIPHLEALAEDISSRSARQSYFDLLQAVAVLARRGG